MFFAVGLAIAAWRAKAESVGVRWFWFGCALLNAVAAAHMIATDFDYTWLLAPPD